MAKLTHENSYFKKVDTEDFTVSYNFTNDLASGEALSSCAASCYTMANTDVTASMLSSIAVSSPSVTFKVSNGIKGNTYQIKLHGTGDALNIYDIFLTCEVYGGVTLNSNPADPNANSYVTVEEANNYIRSMYGHSENWDILSIEGKKRLLIEACRDVDRFNFVNPKYWDFQALRFPDSDHDTVSGNCATPITISGFKNSNLYSTTYGNEKSANNYWKYGSIHITSATPLNDIREIKSSSGTTGAITVTNDFSATPTTNTTFRAFAPIDEKIKQAQIEQALFKIETKGNSTLNNYKSLGAKEVEIGNIRVAFRDSMAGDSGTVSNLSRKLLSRWFRRRRRIGRA